MTTTRTLLFASLASLLLAACVRGDGNSSVFQHLSIRGDGVVVAHSRTGSDAIVTSKGDLTIDNKPVPVTPTQRKLLQDYNRHVLALRTDAVATGKAGGRTAIRSVTAVVEGLVSGNADQIGDKVDRQASEVEALADKVCQHLLDIRSAQEEIIAEIPAFKPFATIAKQQAEDCNRS